MNEPDNASQAQEQNQRIEDNLNKIKNRIVVFIGKGGVGKTTVAVNLSWAPSSWDVSPWKYRPGREVTREYPSF